MLQKKFIIVKWKTKSELLGKLLPQVFILQLQCFVLFCQSSILLDETVNKRPMLFLWRFLLLLQWRRTWRRDVNIVKWINWRNGKIIWRFWLFNKLILRTLRRSDKCEARLKLNIFKLLLRVRLKLLFRVRLKFNWFLLLLVLVLWLIDWRIQSCLVGNSFFLFEIKKKRRFTLRRIKIFLFHDVNNICWSFKRSSSDIMIMQDLKEWKKRGKKYLYRGVDQHCIVTKEVFQIHCFQLFRIIPNQSGENSSEGERRDVLLREDFRNSFDYIFGESCWLWKLGCEGKRTYLPIGFLLVLIQYEMTFCLGFRTGLTWSLKKKRRSPKYLDNGIPPEFWGRRTFSGER